MPPAAGSTATQNAASPAAETTRPTTAPPPESLPSLSTFFQARTADGKVRPLVSGDALRTGDHFWLELVARERLFIWVLYASPDGSAAVIYPTSGEVTLTPERPQRVPETQDFELDEHVGWERLLVVASRERLDSSENQLAKLVAHVRSAHRWPSDPAAPESPEASEKPEQRASATKPERPPPREGTGASLATNSAPYSGPTPVLEPRVAGADTRGLTRGIKLAEAKTGRLDYRPDTDGIIAIPLFLKHEP